MLCMFDRSIQNHFNFTTRYLMTKHVETPKIHACILSSLIIYRMYYIYRMCIILKIIIILSRIAWLYIMHLIWAYIRIYNIDNVFEVAHGWRDAILFHKPWYAHRQNKPLGSQSFCLRRWWTGILEPGQGQAGRCLGFVFQECGYPAK